MKSFLTRLVSLIYFFSFLHALIFMGQTLALSQTTVLSVTLWGICRKLPLKQSFSIMISIPTHRKLANKFRRLVNFRHFTNLPAIQKPENSISPDQTAHHFCKHFIFSSYNSTQVSLYQHSECKNSTKSFLAGSKLAGLTINN
jgi:hypothetical protein